MFKQETWEDRQSEHPKRRLLSPVSGGDAVQYDITRSEGEIIHEGTAFSAENMNSLERRIGVETSSLESALSRVEEGSAATVSYLKDQYFVRSNDSGLILYRALANISAGTVFTAQNCTATDVGTELKRMTDGIAGANQSVTNLGTSVNNALAGLQHSIASLDNTVIRGRRLGWDNFQITNGTATVGPIDCSQWFNNRVNAVTVTAHQIGHYFGAYVTRAGKSQATFVIKDLLDPSWSGVVPELDIIVWGD